MNIKQIFGIPENDSNLELSDIIQSVITKFQPNRPEKSPFSSKEFSLIDDDNKPSIRILDGNARNILFTNLIAVNREDDEKLNDVIFGTTEVYNNAWPTLTIEFSIPLSDDHYFDAFNENNKKTAEHILHEFRDKGSNSLLDIFILANQSIKGLKSVTYGDTKLTTENVLSYLLK